VGLVVLLALFGRAAQLAALAVRRGSNLGWLALAAILVTMLDAIARASFTGFPTAFLALMLLGLALAASGTSEETPSAQP
jgi:hypothetical protein